MTRFLPLLLFVLLFGATSFAQEDVFATVHQSGNGFARTCVVINKPVKDLTGSEGIDLTICLAYVEGVVDGAGFVNKQFPYCSPAGGIERAQAVRVILKFITDSPAIAHEPTAGLVITALHDAFPCRSSRK